MNKKIKVCFLDRDGVINVDKGHIINSKQIFILPKVFELIKIVKQKNYIITVVTNQSVIGRKILTVKKLNEIHKYINIKLKNKNCAIDYFFFCPHHPKYGKGKFKIFCNCRKPEPGMIKSFITKFNIDKKNSFMIGDKLSDFKAAKKSNIKFFFGLRDLSFKNLKNFINNKL